MYDGERCVYMAGCERTIPSKDYQQFFKDELWLVYDEMSDILWGLLPYDSRCWMGSLA